MVERAQSWGQERLGSWLQLDLEPITSFSGSEFPGLSTKQPNSLRSCCSVKIHGDVGLESNRWSLDFQPRKAKHEGRQREEARQVSCWWEKAACLPSTGSYPAFLTCYSNQTNLQLKMRNPSPHTHSTSKLKTFYRLVNLQLRWCSKEQLWSNFDNDENNNHMARFRALLLQLQCSWIDKSD